MASQLSPQVTLYIVYMYVCMYVCMYMYVCMCIVILCVHVLLFEQKVPGSTCYPIYNWSTVWCTGEREGLPSADQSVCSQEENEG